MTTLFKTEITVLSESGSIVKSRRTVVLPFEPKEGQKLYLNLDFVSPLNSNERVTRGTAIILEQVIYDVDEQLFEVQAGIYN